jgi:ribosome recycling factor
MSYKFDDLKEKIDSVEKWLKNEYLSIQTGRATPAILDKLSIDVYGIKSPINQVSGISVEDAKTLRISPWDISLIEPIAKVIEMANLGLSVSRDEKGLRAIFPELTTERRESHVKIIKQKLEDARVSVKKARDDSWQEIQDMEKKGDIGEDEKFRLKSEMQKTIDQANSNLEKVFSSKEKDILGQ